ncbi:MAG: hypothetical protein MK538_16030 [Planctomycetes bacterium]|nr:hypothetical protein [Planctomycetota bacterium]
MIWSSYRGPLDSEFCWGLQRCLMVPVALLATMFFATLLVWPRVDGDSLNTKSPQAKRSDGG